MFTNYHNTMYKELLCYIAIIHTMPIKRSRIATLFKKSHLSFVIIMLLKYLIFLIHKLPLEKNLVLCGSSWGFEGNSRKLYQHMLENEINTVWVAHNEETRKYLFEEDYPAVISHSINYLYLLAKTKAVVCEKSLEDVSIDKRIIPSNIVRVRSRTTVVPTNWMLSSSDKNIEPTNVDILLCTSEYQRKFAIWGEIGNKKKVSSFSNSISSKYKITGFPKTDDLVSPPDHYWKNWKDFHDDSTSAILYAPTRLATASGINELSTEISKDPSSFIFPFENFDLEKLEHFLSKQELHLYVRPHPLDYECLNSSGSELVSKMNNSNHISIISQNDIPLVETLPFVDILLTDYSTVYVEFLLKNKPICFIDVSCYGVDEAKVFAHKFDLFKGGPSVTSFEELLNYIESVNRGDDPYCDKRKKVIKRYHKYTDGKSTERAMDSLLNELNK